MDKDQLDETPSFMIYRVYDKDILQNKKIFYSGSTTKENINDIIHFDDTIEDILNKLAILLIN